MTDLLHQVDRLEERICASLSMTRDEYRSTWPDDFVGLDIVREVIRLAAPVDPEARNPLLVRVKEMLSAALADEAPQARLTAGAQGGNPDPFNS